MDEQEVEAGAEMPPPNPEAEPEPLFTLNLEGNGGLFAPRNLDELHAWLAHEQEIWSGLASPAGPHRAAIDGALQLLVATVKQVNAARQSGTGNEAAVREQASVWRDQVERVFKTMGLPHSSSLLRRRIEEIAARVGSRAASMYAALSLADKPNDLRNQVPLDIHSMQGLALAAADLYGQGLDAALVRDAREKFGELQGQCQALAGEQALALEALQREQQAIGAAIRALHSKQGTDFNTAQDARDEEHKTAIAVHESQLEGLRTTFREAMGLRAPADYWRKKKNRHTFGATLFGLASGALICAAVWVLLRPDSPIQAPKDDPWKVGQIVLASVFAVWFIRVVLRLFLSQLHLAQDASERVTMVTTYLALQEGNKVSPDQDRETILRALFRPATDGIVKDEGLPPSLQEVLTRLGRN